MGDAVTLIVLVAAGAAGDPTTVAMTGATRDALGGAPVEVRETRGAPDDEAALAIETSAHADAIVELRWAPRHGQATLRLHIAAGGRWIERVIRFKPSDAYAERGRTLGFEVASMLPEAAADRSPPPVSPSATPTTSQASTPAATPSASSASPSDSSHPPPTAPTAPPATPVATPPPPQPAAPSAPTPPAQSIPPPPAASPPSPTSPPRDGARVAPAAEGSSAPATAREMALDLTALGAVGMAGTAEKVAGGSVAGHWFVLRTVSLRLAAAVRGGHLDSAEASTLTFLGAAGVVWHAWRPTPSRRLGLSFRADYLLEHPWVTHLSDTHSFRWTSGADALVEAGLLLTADADVVIGIGLEGTFAQTYIDPQSPQAATLPPLNAVGEVGIQLRF